MLTGRTILTVAIATATLLSAIDAGGDNADANACAGGCPILTREVVVDAPLERVWNAWTTNEGLRFISQESNVELRVGGPYEWFLDGPTDERGVPGSKGSRVLAFVPEQMIAFAWTFPPDTPNLRKAGETTTVVVVFEEISAGRVQVRLQALGWQDGAEWRKGWNYFDAAWGSVLQRLQTELDSGRVDALSRCRQTSRPDAR